MKLEEIIHRTLFDDLTHSGIHLSVELRKKLAEEIKKWALEMVGEDAVLNEESHDHPEDDVSINRINETKQVIRQKIEESTK